MNEHVAVLAFRCHLVHARTCDTRDRTPSRDPLLIKNVLGRSLQLLRRPDAINALVSSSMCLGWPEAVLSEEPAVIEAANLSTTLPVPQVSPVLDLTS